MSHKYTVCELLCFDICRSALEGDQLQGNVTSHHPTAGEPAEGEGR